MSKRLKEYKEVDVGSILYGIDVRKAGKGSEEEAQHGPLQYNNPALSPEMAWDNPRIVTLPNMFRQWILGYNSGPVRLWWPRHLTMASTYMAEAGLLHTRSWGSNKDPKVCDETQITATRRTVKDHLLSHSRPKTPQIKEYWNTFSGESAMCTTGQQYNSTNDSSHAAVSQFCL